ncbi:MAG: hypothetical protein KA230_06300 [Flavobacteriales bacterium]|nr:hypothetical protein [Flavobacteriales bacterium]MBP6574038.1 hypothetical protein [Flavobacteriales bacterium]
MLWKSLLFWLLLMVLAITNGAVRLKFIIPATGEPTGHVISTVLLAGLILLATWSGIPWIAPHTARDAFGVGLFWLVLTLAFEFGVGALVSHRSWPEMLADYNVLKGRVWVFIPIITALAPWLMARARGLI